MVDSCFLKQAVHIQFVKYACAIFSNDGASISYAYGTFRILAFIGNKVMHGQEAFNGWYNFLYALATWTSDLIVLHAATIPSVRRLVNGTMNVDDWHCLVKHAPIVSGVVEHCAKGPLVAGDWDSVASALPSAFKRILELLARELELICNVDVVCARSGFCVLFLCIRCISDLAHALL